MKPEVHSQEQFLLKSLPITFVLVTYEGWRPSRLKSHVNAIAFPTHRGSSLNMPSSRRFQPGDQGSTSFFFIKSLFYCRADISFILLMFSSLLFRLTTFPWNKRTINKNESCFHSPFISAFSGCSSMQSSLRSSFIGQKAFCFARSHFFNEVDGESAVEQKTTALHLKAEIFPETRSSTLRERLKFVFVGHSYGSFMTFNRLHQFVFTEKKKIRESHKFLEQTSLMGNLLLCTRSDKGLKKKWKYYEGFFLGKSTQRWNRFSGTKRCGVWSAEEIKLNSLQTWTNFINFATFLKSFRCLPWV